MKYGYRITINLIPHESGYDLCRDMAVFCIENKDDFDTMTEADQTMEHILLKLNVEHPFYINKKEILLKEPNNDALINIKADDITPELEKQMYSILQKIMKNCDLSTDKTK